MRALAVALGAALCLAPITVGMSRPAPHRDWSSTVVATSEGGFRMGNPNAKVKLVEYGSLACPHCRHFEETGYAPLVKSYVITGRVSYEFRNILLNAPDIAMTIVAHCAGAGRFFPMSRVIFESQPQWFEKVAAMSDAQKAEMDKMSDAQRLVRLGEIAGLPQIGARFGITHERIHQCLVDPKGLDRLVNETNAAGGAGIDHTPTFLIDGKVTDASTWERLQPELDSALLGRPSAER